MPRWAGLSCRICGLPLPDGGAHCHVCRRRRRSFRRCRSAGLYEGVLQSCLLQLKYRGREELAEPLGGFLSETWAAMPELGRPDAVVPVPLHLWREIRRGYNQSEKLALSFSRRTGIPVLEGALSRRRATRSQTDLKREERFLNVDDAFRVPDPGRVRGLSLLLVDDVCTTGATLEACARALRAAGARRVSALTVARQV